MAAYCVVVLDGRQPVGVLRFLAPHFALHPFFAFLRGIAVGFTAAVHTVRN